MDTIKNINRTLAAVAIVASLLGSSTASAAGESQHGHDAKATDSMMGKADHQPLDIPVQLVIPMMSPKRGMTTFIEKKCITCHAINGIGGTDAPTIDAHKMQPTMQLFDFSARLWNHSQAMVALQIAALGEQIQLSGQEMADITAFVHDDAVQHTLTEADIPPDVMKFMHHDHGSDGHQ